MKGNVFTTPSASIEDMRDRIVNESANLREDPEMIKKRVFRDMQRRAELCIGWKTCGRTLINFLY